MPLYTGKDGALYAAGSSDECSSTLGRACTANTLVDSGSFESRNGGTALQTIKGVSTFVDFKPDVSGTSQEQQQSSKSNGSQQEQQSSKSNGSQQQQSSQANDSEQQQSSQNNEQTGENEDAEQQQTSQTEQQSESRMLAVQTSDIEKEWEQTTGNFGVGKLD
ncbi:hypothetical protein PHMEG_00040478 [Phytophthora megakarya]|uniref:Uncharacterized protein n=1 Tax=Phytophthora megakarya TaxID=4795 RepID=A0A225UDH9_9STRA|nr:hypothetical protein PHMEG_00040478 [Phytophthora megakarya]